MHKDIIEVLTRLENNGISYSIIKQDRFITVKVGSTMLDFFRGGKLVGIYK